MGIAFTIEGFIELAGKLGVDDAPLELSLAEEREAAQQLESMSSTLAGRVPVGATA